MKIPSASLARTACTCLALLGTVSAVSVSAATTDKGVQRLPDLVVSEKKETSLADLQRVPTSATGFSSDQIRLSGLDSIQYLPSLTPNLSLSNSGGRSFGDNLAIRGLANSAFFSDPSVAVYVDDAPFGDVFTFAPELYDIDQIEVLRGSQSTLFGKNSEAGVINITTRKPTNVHRGEASATYARFGEQAYRASFMGPLVKDQLYYGVSGGYAVRDGLLSNTFRGNDPDNRKGWNGRAFLRWAPAKDWTVSLDASASASNDGAPRTQSLTAPKFSVDSDIGGNLETQNNSQSLRISHPTPDFTFTSITSRREWRLDPLYFDLDLTRFPSPGSGNYALIRQDQEQWSEELRVQSPASEKSLKWLVGFYFGSNVNHGDNTRNFFVPFPGFFETQTTLHSLKSDNIALFGNAMWAASDKLDITVGLRLDQTQKKIKRTKRTTFIPPPSGLSAKDDLSNVGADLTLTYHINDSLLAYGKTGSAFKAGGFSAFIDPPASARFGDEQVWTNEIGLKSTSADKKFSANVALFYYNIRDYQVERSVPFSTDYAVYNAPTANSAGVEIELHAQPCEGFDLSATFGSTNITFDRFNNPGTGATLHGKKPPFVPEFNASVAAQYKDKSGLFGRVEFVAVGETFFDEENSRIMREPSYGTFNARVGYEADRYSVHIFGRNLNNHYHYEKRVAGLFAGVPAAPFTIGIMGTVRF